MKVLPTTVILSSQHITNDVLANFPSEHRFLVMDNLKNTLVKYSDLLGFKFYQI